MTASATLPSLFGRFTAILRDHDHLGHSLVALREMCAALERRAEQAQELEPQRLLRQLRMDLTAHFSAEEGGAYFGAVVEEAPLLSPQVDALKSEHAVMLGAVEVLCQLAAEASEAARLADLARRLIARLEQHERAETALLRALFQPERS